MSELADGLSWALARAAIGTLEEWFEVWDLEPARLPSPKPCGPAQRRRLLTTTSWAFLDHVTRRALSSPPHIVSMAVVDDEPERLLDRPRRLGSRPRRESGSGADER